MYKSKSKVNIFVCVLSLVSHVRLFATPWTVACQAPLSMRFSRQEYWSGLSFPPPGDLPNPGIEPASLMAPASHADSLLLSHWRSLLNHFREHLKYSRTWPPPLDLAELAPDIQYC